MKATPCICPTQIQCSFRNAKQYLLLEARRACTPQKNGKTHDSARDCGTDRGSDIEGLGRPSLLDVCHGKLLSWRLRDSPSRPPLVIVVVALRQRHHSAHNLPTGLPESSINDYAVSCLLYYVYYYSFLSTNLLLSKYCTLTVTRMASAPAMAPATVADTQMSYTLFVRLQQISTLASL